MMKNKLILFFLLFANSLLAAEGISTPDVQNENLGRWQELWNLVSEEIKTIEMVSNNRGPDLDFRLFHLYSEKLGLIKEKENRNFLKESVKDNAKPQKKDFYFQESLKEYERVKKVGLKIIDAYPKYKEIPQVYYSLATNSRDYGKDNRAEEFFIKTVRVAQKSSTLSHQANVGLAEYYYNEKKFEKAVAIYNEIVTETKDEWLAKHFYNRAWCNLKTKNHDRAIQDLLKSYQLGKNKPYISVEEQVLTAIATFFVLSNRAQEGIQFFAKELKTNASPYLLKLARSSAENGQFKEARNALIEALKLETRPAFIAEIRLKELEIYRNFKQEDLYFQAAKEFVKLNSKSKLEQDQIDDFKEKLKSMAGTYQMDLSKRFGHDKKINEVNLNRVIDYFEMISIVSPLETSFYSYYSGETLFSVKHYKESAKFYVKAIETQDKVKPDLSLLKKIFDSYFSVIGDHSYPKNDLKSKSYFGYENFLVFFPKEEKSPWVYQELFALYLADQQYNKAEQLNISYNMAFPQKIDVQKKHFLSLIDHFIKNKNIDQLNRLISIMPKEPFKFDVVETEKAIDILGNILFEQTLAFEKKGQHLKAAEGLEELFKNEIYPPSVRAKSAYNAALIRMDLADEKKAFELASLALPLFPEKEKIHFMPKIGKIALFLGFNQYFTEALKLSSQVLPHLCQHKDLNGALKELILSMIEWQLTGRQFKDAQELAFFKLNKFEKCVNKKLTSDEEISFLSKSLPLVYNHYIVLNFKSEAALFEQEIVAHPSALLLFKAVPQFSESIIENAFDRIYVSFKSEENIKSNVKLIEKISELNPNSAKKAKENLTALAKYRSFHFRFVDSAKVLQSNIVFEGLSPFNQDVFNQSLGKNISQLQTLTQEADEYLKSNDPNYVPFISYNMALTYFNFAQKLESIKPEGVPLDMEKAIKSEMNKLSSKIRAKAITYQQATQKVRRKLFFTGELNETIEDQEIISLKLQKSRVPASVFNNLQILMD